MSSNWSVNDLLMVDGWSSIVDWSSESWGSSVGNYWSSLDFYWFDLFDLNFDRLYSWESIVDNWGSSVGESGENLRVGLRGGRGRGNNCLRLKVLVSVRFFFWALTRKTDLIILLFTTPLRAGECAIGCAWILYSRRGW